MRSYFAAVKPGCILLIFGFTPTLEPPEKRNKTWYLRMASVILVLQCFLYSTDYADLTKKKFHTRRGEKKKVSL
jgi:hypothetical protein